jgi:hypothetical protein
MISIYDIKIDGTFSAGTGTTTGLILFDAGANGRLNISTDNILEGSTNVFYTNARSIGSTLTAYALNSSGVISSSDTILSAFGKVQYQINNKENSITAGTTSQYYRGDKVWATLDKTAVGLSNVDNTSDLNKPISTATQLALNNKVNTSLLGVNNGVATLDSSGKVPTSQLPDSVIGGVIYQGSWNATTNTPTLVSSTGTKGHYYIVSVAGSTLIDGVNEWKVGDWIVFDGTTWDKIDNTDAISSFNGRTGAITLTSSDVTTALTYTPYNSSNPSNYITSAQAPVQTVFGRSGAVVATSGDYNTSQVTENTNLYFTQARAIASVLSTYALGTNTSLSISDTIVGAFGKVQAQLNNKQNSITTGTTAQYFRGDLSLGTLDTLAVAENTNLYFTTSRVLNTALTGYSIGTNTSISGTDSVLVAFGKVQAQLNNKENSIVSGTTSQYYRGDKTFQTLDTLAVAENTNLYFTNARSIASTLTSFTSTTGAVTSADSILSAVQKLYGNSLLYPSLIGTAPISYNSSTGTISIAQSSSSVDGYITATDYNRIYNSWQIGGNTIPATRFLGSTSAFDVQLGTNNVVIATLKNGTNLLDISTGIVVNNLTANKLVFSDGNKQLTSTGIGTSAQFLKADGSIDSTSYLALSGGTLTGNLILNADPTLALGAATKQYVDNLITGLSWKNAVDYATTTNIATLSGLIAVDGVTVSSGDRILVKDQTTQTLNGIYIASTSAWTRSADADIASEILGATVYVEKGNTNATTQWSNNNTSITLGTTNITFVKIAGSGTYTNGNGLLLSSNVFSVDSTKVPYYAALSTGLVRYNGSAWVFDTNTYLTANQTITLTGDITGSGTTSIATSIGAGKVTNTMLVNSSLTIGSTNVSLGSTASTIAGLTLTSPTINGGTHTGITNLGIRSSGTGPFDLSLINTENLSAGRNLTLVLNNADRTLNLGGNLTTTGNNITLNASGSSSVTLPTTGTLATLTGTETLTNKTLGSTNTIGGVTVTVGSDATGDIYYRNASGVLTRLGIGTTGQFLGINTGLPSWTTPGYISSLNGLTASTQTFTNDTNVTIVSNTNTHTVTWVGTLADSRISSASTWNAKQNALNGTGFVRMSGTTVNYISGTSSQFIKADGSLDSNTYALSSALSNYVDLSTNQSVNGVKSFTSALNLSITDNILLTQNTNRIITSLPTYRSSYFGNLSGNSSSAGTDNTGVGHNSLTAITTGTDNTALGSSVLSATNIGSNNIGVGSNSLNLLTSGSRNIGIGTNSLKAVLTNTDNIAIGFSSLISTTANNNTALGSYAGFSNISGAGNVFIGYQAGYSETTSNKLYISNSNTSNPLIYGDFSAKSLIFNGDISITNSADTTKKLSIDTGTNTTSGVTTTLSIQSSGNRTISLPIGNSNDTIILSSATQSMSNKTIGSSNIIGGVTMTLGSDATGDIYYRNVSGVLTRLGIGSSNQVLTVSGGLPTWATSSGVTSLNGLTASSQTFVNDTNVTIVSATNTHTITWSGTLADSRIASASTWNAKQNALNGTGFVKITGTTISYDNTSYLPLSGGTLTGNLILNADPTLALGAATKQYVDNLITGLSWKNAVDMATTANITLSGEQTIDGVLTSTSRILVKDQTNQTQNGIYRTSSGAWTRTSDADIANEILGSTVYVERGTANAATQWSNNNTSITLGTTNITFIKIAGSGTYTNGSGLTLTGNVFSISNLGVTNAMLAGSITSSKLVGADISTVGTITSGVWNGTAISDTYISSASTWNAKQNALNGTGFVRMSGTTVNYISGTSSQFIKADGSLDSNTYVDTTNTQTVGGAKTFSANTTIGSNLILSQSTDSTSTGTNARLGVRTSPYINLTNASLTSIGSVNITGATAGTKLYYTNLTGNTITIINNYGSAIAGEAIYTGVNTNISIPNNAIFVLSYNSTLSAWICNTTTGSFNIQDSQISSATNWNTAFTNRITSLTTTGSSGSATLISNTLNIPTYTLSGLGGIGGSGSANQIAYFSSSNTLSSDSTLYFDPIVGLGLGTSTPASFFEIVGQSSVTDAFYTRYASSTVGYSIVGRKARGTIGTPSAINNGDTIINYAGRAYGTSAWASANRVQMSFIASENWTNTAQGTYIGWSVTPNGGTSTAQVMLLTNTGLTAPSFIRTGGTSSQFLKADGSVDSNTYALNSALSNYVDLTSAQSISGIKTFTSDISVNSMKVGKTAGSGANLTIFGLNALNANTTGGGNTAIGQSALLANTTGNNNTVVGLNNLYQNTTGSANVSIGAGVLASNITGGSIVAIGNAIDVTSDGLNNVVGIGYGASLTTSNTVVLGNASITNVKTSGTLTLGTITLPNTDGTNGQVLTTNGTGTVSWTTVSGGTTYSAGNGLTLTGSTFSINTAITADLSSAQSLTNKKLGSLTTNGFVRTSGGDGTLSVDTTSYLPLTGGTVTGTITLSNSATTGQPTLLGLFNSLNDSVAFRYTEQAITNIPIDTWQFRIGGTTARRLAFTRFDTFEYLNMSGDASTSAIVNIPSTTASSSTSTGALVVGGGIGAGGAIYATSFVRSGGTSSQFLKADGSVDVNTYLTANQTITLSGDISGSGTTAITTSIGAGKVTNAMLAGSIDLPTKVTGILSPGNGGTGVANNPAYTITLGGAITTSNNVIIGSTTNTVTLATTGNTSVTLPTTGTLATLTGVESLTNKKLGSLTANGFVKTSGGDGTLSVDTTTYLASSSYTASDVLSKLLTVDGAGSNLDADLLDGVQGASYIQKTSQIFTKTITIEAPTATENLTIFRTDVAITVVEVIAVSRGTSPSTTYQLKHSTDRSAAGSNLTTSAATTSTTTGNVATLSVPAIAADSWVWLTTSAATGTSVVLTIDIRYTIN